MVKVWTIKHWMYCGLLTFANLICFSQLQPHQVLNSAGGERTLAVVGNTLVLTDNVGEPFIQTVTGGSHMITEGFLQTFNILPGVTDTFLVNHVSCRGRKDGNISVVINNSNPTYTVSYTWSDPSICPTQNCNYVDSLGADTLFVIVRVDRPVIGPFIDTLGPIYVLDIEAPCLVEVFNGVTANADGANDYFYIKNIDQYPNNRVSIYNRWGNVLYDKNGYNNIDIRWPEQSDLGTLVSGTYFYVIELGDGGKPLKGWLELLKN